MPFQEREERLTQGVDDFNSRVELYDKIDMETINDLVDIVSDAWHINRSTLNENTNPKENEQKQKLFTQSLEKLIEKTNILVDSILSLLNSETLNYRDLNLIENDELGTIKENIAEIERMLKALIKSLENKSLNP